MKFLEDLYFVLKYENYSYYSFSRYFLNKKNGIFLYSYLPFLFKIYHFEEIFPKILSNIHNKIVTNTECYDYLIKLHDKLLKRLKRQSKEGIEMCEENFAIVMFLWTVCKNTNEKENIDFLFSLTLNMIKWLGKIENEDENEIKEKEKEEYKIKEEDSNKPSIKNKKERIFYILLDIINKCFSTYLTEYETLYAKGKIISKELLSIVHNHVIKEMELLSNGNRERIINYILCSYSARNRCTNLSIPHYNSYPFSGNTIIFILYIICTTFILRNKDKEIKKQIITETIYASKSYINIIRIIDECDLKKDFSLKEDNDNYRSNLKNKMSLELSTVHSLLYINIRSSYLTFPNKELGKIIVRLINLFFNHSNNKEFNYEKEKVENNKEMKKIRLVRPFILESSYRKNFYYRCFICIIRVLLFLC